MSKSLDSIRYLRFHDALPPDFPVEIRKYQTSEKFLFSISAKQNKWSIDYDFLAYKRSRRDKNMHIASSSVRGQVAFDNN